MVEASVDMRGPLRVAPSSLQLLTDRLRKDSFQIPTLGWIRLLHDFRRYPLRFVASRYVHETAIIVLCPIFLTRNRSPTGAQVQNEQVLDPFHAISTSVALLGSAGHLALRAGYLYRLGACRLRELR